MSLITQKLIENMIYAIRGQKVMLDSDLASLYGVMTKHLNRQVKRNALRFPPEFMFRLTKEEIDRQRCQIGTFKQSTERRKYLPYVFSEYGIAMLSSVLNSEQAIKVNIAIIKIFINLRKVLASNETLSEKIAKLEYDSKEMKNVLKVVFEKVHQIENKIPALPLSRKKIGFK